MIRSRPGPRWSVGWAAAIALGTAAAVIGAAPASAAPADVTAGSLDWGFKASFRSYVSTGDGNPPMSTADGATINGDGTFKFPAAGGTYDSATGAGTVNYSGSVTFSYPAHTFTITVANPTVVLTGSGGTLKADVELVTTGDGFEPVDVTQADIAKIAAGTGTVDGGTTTWTGLGTTLLESGAAAFAGFYTAETPLDPITFSLTTATGGEGDPDPEPGDPTISVNPSTGIDPAGGTVTVTGSGFDPAANNGVGVYVVFGPKRGDYWLNAAIFDSAKWVHPNGPPGGAAQDRMNPDGTFTTTLPVVASYTKDGETVDCLTEGCYVLTFAAHGAQDRSFDTGAAISFAGDDGEPGAGTAEQNITATVGGGALTLTSAGSTVALTAATTGGVATGALNQLTVSDLRGTSSGWSLVGQVEDFTGSTGGTIPADSLGWVPSASVIEDPLAATTPVVTAGPTANPGPGTGLGSARGLCSSAAGASSGSFLCGAQLNLGIPAGTVPGDYAGTLTLTLS